MDLLHDARLIFNIQNWTAVILPNIFEHVEIIRNWIKSFDNLIPIGRSGMFKYNNQDHAIATGLLAARTALGLGEFDPWNVNIDAEYLEEERKEYL